MTYKLHKATMDTMSVLKKSYDARGRHEWTAAIGVIYGGYEGYRYPPFSTEGYRTPHFLGQKGEEFMSPAVNKCDL